MLGLTSLRRRWRRWAAQPRPWHDLDELLWLFCCAGLYLGSLNLLALLLACGVWSWAWTLCPYLIAACAYAALAIRLCLRRGGDDGP